jgi:hypothetical protein
MIASSAKRGALSVPALRPPNSSVRRWPIGTHVAEATPHRESKRGYLRAASIRGPFDEAASGPEQSTETTE